MYMLKFPVSKGLERFKSGAEDPSSQMFEEEDKIDWDNIDFETGPQIKAEDFKSKIISEEIDFESDKPIMEVPEPTSFTEDFLIPTAKAIPKVVGAIGGSLVLMPGSGIRAAIELLPRISTDPNKPLIEFGSLSKAGEIFEEIMSVPGKLITSEEEAKAVENIGYVMKPIEMAGEGWRLIGEQANEGLKSLGFSDTYIEPLLATYGEAAAIFALPEVIKKIKMSTPMRQFTIKERGLVVQSLADAIKKNPNMTQGEILRRFDNPNWRAEALEARGVARNPLPVDPPKGSVPKPATPITKPEVPAEYTFRSKKGNVYERVEGRWFDKEGKEVTNKYVVDAAEKGKVTPGVEVEVAAPTVAGATYLSKGEEGLHYWNVETAKGATTVTTKTLDVKEVRERVAEVKKTFEGKEVDLSDMSPAERRMVETLARVEKAEPKVEETPSQKVIRRRKGKEEVVVETKPEKITPVEEPTLVEPTVVESEPTLDVEKSPFRTPPAETLRIKKEHETRKWSDTPLGISRDLENKVNRYLDGDSQVDIEKVRGDINTFIGMLKDPSNMIPLVDALGSTAEVNSFIELTEQMAEWANAADHSKIKQSGVEEPEPPSIDPDLAAELLRIDALEKHYKKPVEKITDKEIEKFFRSQEGTLGEVNWFGDTKLNVMIPLEDIPKAVKGLFDKVMGSKVPVRKLYRNKELWEKTGFWLGRDGMWRFELPKEAIKPDWMKIKETYQEDDGRLRYKDHKFSEVVNAPKLFESVPRLKYTWIRIDENLPIGQSGRYIPGDRGSDIIEIKKFGDRKTLQHELQHAINEAVGSEFKGSNVEFESRKIVADRIAKIGRKIFDKDPKYSKQLLDVASELEQGRLGTSYDPLYEARRVADVIAKDKDKFGVTDADVRSLEFPVDRQAKHAYKTDLGEMESRLSEKRMEMTPEQRAKEAPWETLDKMLAEEFPNMEVKARESLSNELYSGTPVDAFYKMVKGAIDKFKPKNISEKPSDPSIKEDVKEIVFGRRGRLDLTNYNTNRFLNSIDQKTTSAQQDILTFMMEKTGIPDEFKRPDLQKVLEKDKVKLEPIAKDLKEWLSLSFKKIKHYLPDMTVKEIENYITHIWDIPKHKRAEAVNWFSTQNRFMERRFIPTYFEGIQKMGYMPKTTNVLEIIRVHDAVSNKAIENVKYINALLALERDGIKLVDRSDSAPLDWIEVDYPALTRRIPLSKREAKAKKEFVKEIKVRVHPDLVRPLKAIFEERFDHPIISAYEAINGVMKKGMLTASLFHHGALGETGLALMGPVKTAKIYFDPVKIYKGLAKGELDIFEKEWIARDSIIHGVQYGATADIPVARIQRYLNDLARVSKDITLVNKLTAFARDANSVWDKALWNYLHDTLKLYGYESLVAKLDTNLNPRQTMYAKREVASFVNDTFGGQNWDNLMVTPKEVQMLTWSLLSADWTVSTTRQALAPTGIGKIYAETEPIRKKMGRMFWLRAALYFGIGMNVLNALFRDQDMKENPQYYEDQEYSWFDKTMFGNTVGKRTYLFKGRYEDGSERYIRWGKQFRDFFELLTNPVKKIGGKVAPLPQFLSEVFTGHSLSGYRSDDLYGKEGLDYAIGLAKTIAKAPLPLSIRKFMQEDIEFKPLDIVMQSSKGMSRYTAIDYFKKAIVEGDEKMLEETYQGALRNNLPAFTLFNSALSWAEAEATADLRETTDEIEDVRAKMSLSDNAADKRRYGKILQRLEKEKADKRMGLRLFKGAVQKSKTYMAPEGRSEVPRLPSSRVQGNAPREEIRFE